MDSSNPNSVFNSESPSQIRAFKLKSLSTDIFDIVIVGGGINGAAIARDASMRGSLFVFIIILFLFLFLFLFRS